MITFVFKYKVIMEEQDFNLGLSRMLSAKAQADGGQAPTEKEIQEISDFYSGREREAFQSILESMGEEPTDEDLDSIVSAYPRIEKKNEIQPTLEEDFQELESQSGVVQQDSTSPTSQSVVSGTSEFISNQYKDSQDQAPVEEDEGNVFQKGWKWLQDQRAKVKGYQEKKRNLELVARREDAEKQRDRGLRLSPSQEEILGATVKTATEQMPVPKEFYGNMEWSVDRGASQADYYLKLSNQFKNLTNIEQSELVTKLAKRGDFNEFIKTDPNWHEQLGEMVGSQIPALVIGAITGPLAPVAAAGIQSAQSQTQSFTGYYQKGKDLGMDDNEATEKAAVMAKISGEHAWMEGLIGTVNPFSGQGAKLLAKAIYKTADVGVDAGAAAVAQLMENDIAKAQDFPTEYWDGVAEQAAGEAIFSVMTGVLGLPKAGLARFSKKINNNPNLTDADKVKINKKLRIEDTAKKTEEKPVPKPTETQPVKEEKKAPVKKEEKFVPKSDLNEKEVSRIKELNKQADQAIVDKDVKAGEDAVAEISSIKATAEARKGENLTNKETKEVAFLEKKMKSHLLKNEVKEAKKISAQIDKIKDAGFERKELTPEQKTEPAKETKEPIKEEEKPKKNYTQRSEAANKALSNANNEIVALNEDIEDLKTRRMTKEVRRSLADKRKQLNEAKKIARQRTKEKKAVKSENVFEAVEKLKLNNEGSSFDTDLNQKEFGKDENFVVSTIEENHDTSDMSVEKIQEFKDKNQKKIDQLKKRGQRLTIGTYGFNDGKKSSIDLSIVFKSFKNALAHARKNNQESLYDTRKDVLIDTKTGKPFIQVEIDAQKAQSKEKTIVDEGEIKTVEGLDPNKEIVESFDTKDGVVYVQRDGDEYLIVPDKEDGTTSVMKKASEILESTDPKFKELKGIIKENIEAWEKGTHATGDYINDIADQSTLEIEERVNKRKGEPIKEGKNKGQRILDAVKKEFRDLESARDLADKIELYNRYFAEGDMEKAAKWRLAADQQSSNAGTVLNVAMQMSSSTPAGLYNSAVKGIEDTGRKLDQQTKDELQRITKEIIDAKKELDKISRDIAKKKGVTSAQVVDQVNKLNHKKDKLTLELRSLANRKLKRSRVGMFTSQMIGSLFAIPSLLGNIAGNRYQSFNRGVSGRIADALIIARRTALRGSKYDDKRSLTDGTLFGRKASSMRQFVERNQEALISAYTTGAPIGENRFELGTQLRAWDNMMTMAAAAKAKSEGDSKAFWDKVWSDPAVNKTEDGKVTTATKAKFLAEIGTSLIPDFALRSLLVGDLSFRTGAKQTQLVRAMSLYGTLPIKNFNDAQVEFLKTEATAKQKRNEAAHANGKRKEDLLRVARQKEQIIKKVKQQLRDASDMAVFTKDAPVTVATMKLVKALDGLADTSGDLAFWKQEGLDKKFVAFGKESLNAMFKVFRAVNLPFPKIPANIGAAAFDMVFPISPAVKVAWGTKVGDQQMIQDGLGKLLTSGAIYALTAALPGLVFFVDEEEMKNASVKDSALARTRNGSINVSRVNRMATGRNTDKFEEKGDTWVSLNRIGPLGAAFMMIGASDHLHEKARKDEKGKLVKPIPVWISKMAKSFGVAASEQPTLTGLTNILSVSTGEFSMYQVQNMIRTMSAVFNPAIIRNIAIKGITDSESVNKRGMEFGARWLNDMYTDNALFHYGDKVMNDESKAYATPKMVSLDKNKVQSMNLPHLNLRGEIADPTQDPVLQWLSSNIDVFNSNRSEATKLDMELFDVMKNLPDNYEGRTIYADPSETLQWDGWDNKINVKLMRGDHWEMIREARRRKALELDYLVQSDWWNDLSYEEKADEFKEVNTDVNAEVREEWASLLEDFDFSGALIKDKGAWKGTGMEYKYRE